MDDEEMYDWENYAHSLERRLLTKPSEGPAMSDLGYPYDRYITNLESRLACSDAALAESNKLLGIQTAHVEKAEAECDRLRERIAETRRVAEQLYDQERITSYERDALEGASDE